MLTCSHQRCLDPGVCPNLVACRVKENKIIRLCWQYLLSSYTHRHTPKSARGRQTSKLVWKRAVGEKLHEREVLIGLSYFNFEYSGAWQLLTVDIWHRCHLPKCRWVFSVSSVSFTNERQQLQAEFWTTVIKRKDKQRDEELLLTPNCRVDASCLNLAQSHDASPGLYYLKLGAEQECLFRPDFSCI